MTIEPLTWDSDFFGIKIGRCFLIDNEDFETGKLYQWDLVYFFIKPGQNFSNDRMKGLNIPLVDKKVIYMMELAGIESHDLTVTNVTSYIRDDKLPDVVRIGIQSGIYSRFCVDPNIPKKKFEELYTTWMLRSVDREIAREVFVYKGTDDQIAGVLTLGDKNDRADIGILAVDEKFRGMNIGKKLINASIKNSVENGYKKLQVVTQKDNKSACRFYEQCGFTEEKVVDVYHYWNKQ